jgi:tetratricopeptide (TPR) repeat protein
MKNLASVIDLINQQVDGQELIRLTQYHVDKVQLKDSTLRCFCPVHRELAFRSLVLNLTAHSYKCMMRRCKCYDGGKFVDFWSIFANKERIEAALDLAERLHLNVDADALRQLGRDREQQALDFLKAGHVEQARAAIEEALALDPGNGQCRLASAGVWLAMGREQEAFDDQLVALDAWIRNKSLDQAGKLLDELLARHPDHPRLLDHQASLARHQGQTAKIVEALEKRAELLERQGQDAEALAALSEARKLTPKNIALLERVAEIGLRLGRLEDRQDALADLTRLYEEKGDRRRVLEALGQRIEHAPDNLDLRRQRAKALERDGLKDQARKELLFVIEQLTRQGAAAEAIEQIEALTAQVAKDLELRERLAGLLDRNGQHERAFHAYRELAVAARKKSQDDRAGRCFELARAIAPGNSRLRLEMAQWRIEEGDVEGGLNDMFVVAVQCLDDGAVKDVKEILARIVALAPVDVDKRVRVGRCMERAGLEEEAFRNYLSLASELSGQGRMDAAVAICEEARRLRPTNAEALELRVRAHLALKQVDEAMEACREAARACKAANDAKGVETALLRAMEIDREQAGPKVDLALFYEQSGRDDKALGLWLELAKLHRARRQMEEANDAAREALRLDADNREARVLLADGLEATGKTREALEAWIALGRSRLATDGNADALALDWLRRALALAPRQTGLLADVAGLTLKLQDAKQALPVFAQWLDALENEPGQEEATLAAYRQAVEAFPNRVEWRARLAALLLGAGLRDEAADQYEAMLDVIDRQGGPGAEEQAAEEGRPLDVVAWRHEILEKLAVLRPESSRVQVELARSNLSMGHVTEAIDIYLELAEQSLRQEQPESALALYEEALEAEPDHAELLKKAAELDESLGLGDAACAWYDRLAEVNRRITDRSINIPILEKLIGYRPNDCTLRAELADLYESDGDVERAVEHAFALARLHHAENASVETIALCQRIRGLAPDFVPARELLVEGLLASDEIDKAKQELDSLGDLALVAGDVDQAEAFFKRILRIDPNDIGSGERLGKLYEAAGKLDEAAEAFQHVLAVYENMREIARAVGVLQKLKQLRPGDLETRLRLARALLAARSDRREAGDEWMELIEEARRQGREDLVQGALTEVEPVFHQDWPWRMRLARLLSEDARAERGKNDDRGAMKDAALSAWESLAKDALEEHACEVAREAAGEGLLLEPGMARLRDLRVNANRRLSNYEGAAEDLRWMAENAAVAGDFEHAIAFLQQALELCPRAHDLLEMLAGIYQAAGQLDLARQSLRKLAEMHRLDGDVDRAIERARRILKLAEPGDEEAADYLAGLLLESGRIDEAMDIGRGLAESAAERGERDLALRRYAGMLVYLPGNVEILRRLADLTRQMGGMAAALAHYDRLLDAMHAAGDVAATEAEYRRVLEMEPACLQVKERLAEFLATQGRVEEARDALLEVVAAQRDERDQVDEALRVLRRLQALDPDNIEACEQEAALLENMDLPEEAAGAWRKIAMAHRQQQDLARAAGCTAHCAELESGSARAQLDAADLFVSIGEPERAVEYYMRAIDIYDRQDKVESCVEALERALLACPNRLDLLEALAGVHERLGRMDRAAARWLELGARLEEENKPDDAARVYLRLREDAPDNKECLERLASLHERVGNRQAATAELRELALVAGQENDLEAKAGYLRRLLVIEPNDAQCLAQLSEVARALDRKDDLFELLARLERVHCAAGREDEALATLDELKALRPDDPEIMTRSIELLVKTGRVDVAARQGIELIQVYFDRGDDQRALEMLSHIAEIEPANVERRISLARLVHVNGREQAAFQEFFLLASRLFGEDQHEACLAACNAGLELFTDEVRLRDLMGRALLKLGRRPEAIEVQLHLAALHDERGEEAKAQRVYEVILEEDPDHRATLEAMIDWAMRHARYGVAVEHLTRLAESNYLAGELDQAIDAMERIQTVDPTRLDLKARLAEIYLQAGDQAGACTTWMAAARGMTGAGDHAGAVAIYEKTLELEADNIQILEALAEAYANSGRPEDYLRCAKQLAERCMQSDDPRHARLALEAMAQRYPDDARAWEGLAGIYRAEGNVESAIDANLRLCEIHRAARRLAEARQCLEAALELAPKRVDLMEAMGDLLLSLGRRADGVEMLGRAAQCLVEQGRHEQARDLCQRVLKLDPANLSARRMLGEALERLGQVAEAMEAYRQVARARAEARENVEAIEVLRHMLGLDAGLIDERELYAKLLRREGQNKESQEQWLHLLEAIGEEEDPRRAIKYCRQILEDDPDNPRAHEHLLVIYERIEKWRQAFQECEWLAAHDQSHDDARQAEAHIRKALAWFPEELGMRARLVDLLIDAARVNEAGDELAEVARQAEARADLRVTRWAMEKACAIKPGDLDAHRSLAEFLERQGELEEARAARVRLIGLMLEQGRMEEARAMAEKVVEAMADDETARVQIANMFEQAGLPEVAAFHYHHLARRALGAEQYEQAMAHARRAIQIKPRHVGARETLIAALLAQRENAKALDEYQALYELYDAASEWDGALRVLQATIDLSPSSPEPRRKLVALYRKMRREEPMVDQLRRLVEIHVNAGDYGSAVDCLRDLMLIRPDDTRARLRYIDLYSQIGDESELLDDYMQLARILGRKGAVVEAMRAYEKLLQVHPSNPSCREEFVQFLFDQGQVSRGIEESRALADLLGADDKPHEAGRVLERALNYAPDEIDMRQKLADVYLKTNRRGLALDAFRSLARHFEQAGDLRRLLDIIEQIVAIDPLNLDYRQRMVELYFRNGMEEQGCRQALALADQCLEREMHDLAEREIRRVLNVRKDDAELWRRLIDTHLKIGQMSDLLPDLHVLADLYQSRGKIKDAIGIYRMIMQCEPNNAAVLQRYIDLYMEIGLEQDLVEDYMRLADLKSKAGDIAGAGRVYQHLATALPDDTVVRNRLAHVNELLAQKGATGAPPRATGTPPAFADASTSSDPSATQRTIRQYKSLLSHNPRNSETLLKLAEALDSDGDPIAAVEYWRKAIGQCLEKGDAKRCVEVADLYLSGHPDDTSVHAMRKRAVMQRDSMRAVDDALFKKP